MKIEGPADRSLLIPSAAPLFATFYTTAAYREDAERLGRCCRFFGLPFTLVQGEDFGSWKRNCNQKPRLLHKLRRAISGPIVWLDADCVIHHPPSVLLQERTEDAVLWNGGISDKPYISSQVMWWNDTATARAMIADWSQRSIDNPESLADPLLKATFAAWRERANVGVLPPEYLKPYWKPVDGVTPQGIVISSNERRCVHADATPRQNRIRLEPLRLPYEAHEA